MKKLTYKSVSTYKKLSENIIVIDSYSVDNTEEICKKIMLVFSKINFTIKVLNLIGQ